MTGSASSAKAEVRAREGRAWVEKFLVALGAIVPSEGFHKLAGRAVLPQFWAVGKMPPDVFMAFGADTAQRLMVEVSQARPQFILL
jgi:hypothetical protein